MKKIIALLLAMMMLLSLAACASSGSTNGGNGGNSDNQTAPETPIEKTKAILNETPLAPAVQAENKAESQLDDFLSPLPNLKQITNNLGGMMTADGLGLALNANMAGKDMQINLAATAAANLKTKQARVDLNVDAQQLLGAPASAVLYVDANVLKLASDQIFGQGKGVELPLTNFVQDWNNSALSELTGSKLPEDFPLQDFLNVMNFEPDDVVKQLENLYGADWTAFKDSVQLTEKTENKHFTEGGKVCEITWDKASVDAMGAKAEEVMKEFEGVDDEDPMAILGMLQKHPIPELIAHFVVYALREYQNSDAYVELLMADDETLVGLFVGSTEEEGGFELRLLGEGNIWEHVVITVYKENSIEGGDIRMQVEGQKLIVTVSSFEAEAGQTPEPEEMGKLIYDDPTGSISVLQGEKEVLPAGLIFIKPANGGVLCDLNMKDLINQYSAMDPDYDRDNDLEEDGEFDGPGSGFEGMDTFKLTIAVTPMTGAIAQLPQAGTNILTLDQAGLQNLVQEIQTNLKNNFPGLANLMERDS